MLNWCVCEVVLQFLILFPNWDYETDEEYKSVNWHSDEFYLFWIELLTEIECDIVELMCSGMSLIRKGGVCDLFIVHCLMNLICFWMGYDRWCFGKALGETLISIVWVVLGFMGTVSGYCERGVKYKNWAFEV